MHELLRPPSACQDQRERTAFPSQANSYFEEGAAELLLYRPFGNEVKRLPIRRKIERISILELPDTGPELSEQGTQLIEMTFSFSR